MEKKVILLTLDGWGLSPVSSGNAIKLANPENFYYLWRSYPHWILNTHPYKSSGFNIIDSNLSSAVLSCGRFLPTNLELINRKIRDKTFFSNQVLNKLIDRCKEYKSALHLIGLISSAGIYSHIDHLFALIKLAKDKGVGEVFIHAICDGVDVLPNSAENEIDKIQKYLDDMDIGKIATVVGRNYCFDQEADFNMIEKSYHAMVKGNGKKSLSAKNASAESKLNHNSDALIIPTSIYEQGYPIGRINDFDNVIFFNYDDESLKSLSSFFIGQAHAIHNKEVYNVSVAMFSDYFYLTENKSFEIIFARDDFEPNIAKVLSENNKLQLYISEQCKVSSAIYSFCGSKNTSLGQTNLIINSSNSFETSSENVFNQLMKSLNNKYDFIRANFSAADHSAHSGSIIKTIDFVKIIDSYLGKIEQATLAHDYTLLITSDHGFIEQLTNRYESKSLMTHSKNPVPLIYISKGLLKKVYNLEAYDNLLTEIIASKLTICDIAPTILKLFKIDKPNQMTGNPLI